MTVLGLSLFTSVLAGCGESLKLAPVSGAITVDGKPVVIGTIRFCPDESKGNISTHQIAGELDKKGNYRMYFKEQENVPLGWYKVVVFAYQSLSTQPVSLIDTKYNKESSTPLAIEVVENPQPGAYDINLTSRFQKQR